MTYTVVARAAGIFAGITGAALPSALVLLLTANQALAGLMLYPTRVVFEGNERADQVELINNGTGSATYRISLMNRRMTETGGFDEVDEPLPGERFADNLLRYSPRQVTLAPGESQTVRIMVRKPAGLANGEYRSHLLVVEQPDSSGDDAVAPRGGAPGSGIGIRLRTLIGTSIPLIVRHGKTTASVTLTNLELRHSGEQAPVLSFTMERRGSQSVYGDLTVTFQPSRGSEQVIGRANGVAVYTPNPVRHASIVLEPPENMALTNGTLRITYREQAEDGGERLDATELAVH